MPQNEAFFVTDERYGMRRPALSWIVLIASLALTVIATVTVARSVGERDALRFDNAVQTATDRIRTRMQTYLALLRGGAGFFAATDGRVTLAQFQAYAGRIDVRERYPGIQGIGYSLRIPAASRDSVLQSMQAQGQENFRFWPAGRGDERHAIVYLEPPDERNLNAMGYDMYSDPIRREAMARAWAEGEPAMSGVVTLVQEIEGPHQNGFLIYVPVYREGGIPQTAAERRERLSGFVYGAFRAGDLFEGIFGTERNPRVAFRIYDGTRVDSTSLLHDSRSGGIAPAAVPSFVTTTTLATAGRVWTIAFTETPYFTSGLQRSLLPIFAFAGLAISFILFALVRAQGRTDMLVRQSEQRLRTTLESLPVGVFVTDPSGEITFANSAVSRIWRDEGRFDSRLHEGFRGWWHDSEKPLTRDDWCLTRALRGETVPGQIVDIEAFNGERRTILNSAFPVHAISGKLEMAVAVAIDITEQKRAEAALRERNREFSLMANSIPQLAWMADETGAIFWFNERWYTYTGTNPTTAKDWKWIKLHHPEHSERVVEGYRRCLETGEEWEDTFPLRGQDGNYRWFLSRAVPFRDEDGEIVRWFGTNTDVTDQMRARENEARALREQAAREAAEAREGELRALAEELERSNRELQDFAYVASHDLQEPLRKIATFSDLLRDEFADQLNEQGLHYLKRMESAAHRMGRLIRDLLAFSRVSTRPGSFEEVDLNQALADVLGDLEFRIRETGGKVDVGELGTIEADPTQMRQLLQNLIGNALKFHRDGVPPHVRVSGHYETPSGPDGDMREGIFQLEVEDNGIGFDLKYSDRIFSPFQRLHGREQFEGTGMGLAISRRIVERHGGTISARSTPGEGSRFIVRLPVSTPDSASRESAVREYGT